LLLLIIIVDQLGEWQLQITYLPRTCAFYTPGGLESKTSLWPTIASHKSGSKSSKGKDIDRSTPWSEYVWDAQGYWISTRKNPEGEWEYEYSYPETPETPETPRTVPGAENYYKIPPVTENIEPPIPYQKMIVLHAL
jgi:hypothetical protein